MLGGLERVHPADVSTSLAFIDKLIRPSHGGEGGGSEEGGSEGGESSRVAGSSGAEPALPHGAGAIALDCGAGIGRVSSTVLLERFEQAKSHTPFFVFLPFDRGAGIGEVSSHLLLERFEQPKSHTTSTLSISLSICRTSHSSFIQITTRFLSPPQFHNPPVHFNIHPSQTGGASRASWELPLCCA